MANLERLRELRDYFAGLDPDQIRMDIWWCGTEGCLLGHACTMPQFQKEGLKLTKHHFDLTSAFGLWPGLGSEAADNKSLVTDGEYDPFNVGRNFFGLTKKEARQLFSDCKGKSREFIKDKVLAKLDKVIAGHTPQFSNVPVVVEEVTPQEDVQRTPLAN